MTDKKVMHMIKSALLSHSWSRRWIASLLPNADIFVVWVPWKPYIDTSANVRDCKAIARRCLRDWKHLVIQLESEYEKMNQKGCPTNHNAVPKQIRKRLALWELSYILISRTSVVTLTVQCMVLKWPKQRMNAQLEVLWKYSRIRSDSFILNSA